MTPDQPVFDEMERIEIIQRAVLVALKREDAVNLRTIGNLLIKKAETIEMYDNWKMNL